MEPKQFEDVWYTEGRSLGKKTFAMVFTESITIAPVY